MKIRVRRNQGFTRVCRSALAFALLMMSVLSLMAQSTPDSVSTSSNASSSAPNTANVPDKQEPPADRSIRGATQEWILVDGLTRSFWLYVPRKYRSHESALIIALHGRGSGGPGTAMEQYTSLDEKADQVGFAVAYLDGLTDAIGTVNWNYFYDPFFTTAPNDVSFVRETIDSLQNRIHPDRRRIYVTGTSAGGFMAERVGVELSDCVAAIGVVEGGLFVYSPQSPQTIPNAAEPISVLLLKGDQDPFNQYCGAIFPSFGATEASSDQDFDYWAGPSANQCLRVYPNASLCNSIGVGDAQGNVTPGMTSSLVRKEAAGCRADTEVRLYRLLGGGDRWNQAPMNVPGQAPFNPDLDAHTGVTTNDILWKFFEEHRKRE